MSDGPAATSISGRLVLDDRVAAGRITIEDGRIAAVDLDDGDASGAEPLIAPGYVDVHVHGWGGHDAMGDRAALDGMARALLRRGVTSFLPTAVSAPLPALAAFAERVRAWLPDAPADGAEPLGLNLEGPFLAAPKRGAHDLGCAPRSERSSQERPRAAARRATAHHHRARSSPARRTSSAGSTITGWRSRSAIRRRRSTRHERATRPARPARPTCSTR